MCEICAPQIVGCIVAEIGARAAGFEAQIAAREYRNLRGRGDDPVHVAEPAREKRRGALGNIMVGLEPRPKPAPRPVMGFIRRRRQRIDLAKAHERFHLVAIAPHRFFHLTQPRHQRIGTVRHQHRPVAQVPQQHVEQCKALRIVVAGHRIGKRYECLWHTHLRGRRGGQRQRRIVEQIAGAARAFPDDVVGMHVRRNQRAGGMSPFAGNIGRSNVGADHHRRCALRSAATAARAAQSGGADALNRSARRATSRAHE